MLKSKKERTHLPDDYCRNTGQNMEYVITKIRGGKYIEGKSRDKTKRMRKY